MRVIRIIFSVAAFLTAGLAFAQTATPSAPDSGQEKKSQDIVELSPFVVNSTGDEGYGTSAALGGTRINQALIDSSMSITNLNKEFLEDLGFTQLSEQVQFVSGMSSTGAQADGRYASRGRFSAGSNFRDGMPEAFGVNSTEQVDGALFDRIEIIKGPAGVLFGSMDIGGTVNRISKRPLPINKTTVGVSYNTLGTFRSDFDTSQVLYSDAKGTLAYRIAGAWQDGQSDDGSLDNRRAINPSIQYTSAKGDTLWLYYIFQNVASGTRDTTPGDKNGNPFPYTNPGYPLYGDTSPRWDNRRIFEAGYTKTFQLFGNDSAYRLVVRYLNNDQDRANSANGAYNVYDPSGKLLGTNGTLLWDNVTVGRLEWGGLIKSEQWVSTKGGSVNTDFSTKFKLFGGNHTLFTYLEGVQLETPNYILQSVTRPTGYSRWPVYQLPLDWANYLNDPASKTAVNGNTISKNLNLAAAAQDSVSYWDNRLIFTVGARYDDGKTQSQNRLAAGAPWVTNTYGDWSSKYGVVIKPFASKTFALFYNNSNTFTPVSTVDSAKSSPTFGQKFPDQIGEGQEVGAKADMFGSRLVGSIVYFDSSLTNQLITLAGPDGSDIRQPIGKVNTRGIELDLSARVSSSVTLMASFSDLKALTLTGIPLRGNPQKTVAFLGKYSFQQRILKGFSIAAGYRYAADRAGDNNGTFYTPNLELFNLNLIYVRKSWRAQINIDNLMDSKQVTGSVDVNRLDLYNKRNVTFKLSRTF